MCIVSLTVYNASCTEAMEEDLGDVGSPEVGGRIHIVFLANFTGLLLRVYIRVLLRLCGLLLFAALSKKCLVLRKDPQAT